jgi:hypothetical protein
VDWAALQISFQHESKKTKPGTVRQVGRRVRKIVNEKMSSRVVIGAAAMEAQ